MSTELNDPAPRISERDIERWEKLICERPEGPWVMGNGGSFDRTKIKPISDEMLLELALWLRQGYTPWNGRSMPLSAGDRQFMYMLYYSVQGLISRMRAAEKEAADAKAALQAPAVAPQKPLTDAQIEELKDDGVFYESCKGIVREIERLHGISVSKPPVHSTGDGNA